MADVVLMADAEIGTEAELLTTQFFTDVEGMRRRRAAAGSLRSGAMLVEIRTIGEESLELLKAKAETVFVATWPRAIWIDESEEAALMASARTHLEALHAVVQERMRTAVREIAAQPAVLGELEPPLDACLDHCKRRLVLVLQQLRQAGSTSMARRAIGVVPALAKALAKFLLGLLPGK